ncbi:hypothetical protein BDZ91DRAFT_438069 [Kalaharituber pfeilii]|nr:hypothetical protein BDZ91DRAFT_438069 [Kalaharituber pfeilii]
MPQLYSAILHTSTPIYSIHTDSIQKSIYIRRLEGEIWIDSSYNIISVDSKKSLPLDIYKYFPKNTGIPIQNSYIFADGIFIVKKIDNSLSFQLRALHISQALNQLLLDKLLNSFQLHRLLDHCSFYSNF